MQQHRVRAGVLCLALVLLMSVFAPLGAGAQQPLPPPAPGEQVSGNTYIEPRVLKALRDAISDTADRNSLPTVRVIVSFETTKGRGGAGVTADDVSTAAAQVLTALPAGTYEIVSTYRRIPALSLEVTQASLDALARHPLVYAVALDSTVRMHMPQALGVTGVPLVHSQGLTGDGIRVAIIDSGVDTDHPALADDLIHQGCFRTENDCPGGNPANAEDQVGHGTHVAGIITGSNGVAPDVEFAALKVFTVGSTSDTNILNALDFVIDNTNSGLNLGFDFVNLSLGAENYADQASCDAAGAAYVAAFSALNALGVTVFASTGNDADINGVGTPGCSTGAIGVGSSGDATFGPYLFSSCTDFGALDKITCFSNTTPVQGAGELVDLIAPGCDITSEWLAGGTNTICGTSMATPYALGVAALLGEYLLDESQVLTPAEIEQHLEDTADQISDYRLPSGPTFARINAATAIAALGIEAPTGFTITGSTANSVDMEWTGSDGAVSYTVFSSNDGVTFTVAGMTADTDFTDATPECGLQTYHVRAFDGTYYSLASNTDTVTARPCPLTPTSLSLSYIDEDEITLNWVDNATDETAYIVERSVNGADFITLSTLGANAVTANDGPLACSYYEYRVVAERGIDHSAYSNVVAAALCAPDNDLFENAETIAAVNGSPVSDVEANIRYASRSLDDPDQQCRFGSTAAGFQTVWYTLTPAAASRMTITTTGTTAQNPGGAPDTTVSIYEMKGSDLNEVACDDDAAAGYLSSILVMLDAGTTYWVMVSQWEGLEPTTSTGSLTVNFAFVAGTAPANDRHENATVVDEAAYTDSVADAQTATMNAHDPLHDCDTLNGGIGSQNLWWVFTPTSDGEIDVSTEGSTGGYTDTLLSVYTGDYGDLTTVGCDDQSGTGDLSAIAGLEVTGGTTYSILVSRWSLLPTASASTATLNLDFTSDPGVGVEPVEVDVTEGGATATYSVVLFTAPASAVTITATGDADCSVSSPLTFTTGDWDTPQDITVTAVDDSEIEGTHTCTITNAASGDATYAALTVDSVTGTITDDDSAETELLDNGGFEDDADTDKVPDGWSAKKALNGDKLVCNVAKANSGDCAYKFKGGVGEKTNLQQTVDLTGVTFATGDDLEFSMMYNAGHATADLKPKVVVKFSDATPNVKIVASFGQSTGYEEGAASYDGLPSGAVSMIKVTLRHRSLKSKIWVDDVSLTLVGSPDTRNGGDVLAPPAAPDGMRGSN